MTINRRNFLQALGLAPIAAKSYFFFGGIFRPRTEVVKPRLGLLFTQTMGGKVKQVFKAIDPRKASQDLRVPFKPDWYGDLDVTFIDERPDAVHRDGIYWGFEEVDRVRTFKLPKVDYDAIARLSKMSGRPTL